MASKIQLLNFRELDTADRAAWDEIRLASPNLASPYFSPAFFDAVEAVRPGVRVLRHAQGDEPKAFLPGRAGPLGTLRPTAGPMEDLHGVIAHDTTCLDLTSPEVARRLAGYTYSAVPIDQYRHGLHGSQGDGNSVMDLHAGYGAYVDARSAASSNFRRELRKAEALLKRDYVEVVHDQFDADTFERMIALKQMAYRDAGYFDLFSLDWPADLLRHLAENPAPGASGIFSMLKLAGVPVAMSYCLASEQVLHYWFPAYEPAFAKLKPGLALLFSLAEWAAGTGRGEVHLGLGQMQYKRQLGSYFMPVRAGTLGLMPPQKLATQLSRISEQFEDRGFDKAAKLTRKYNRVVLMGSLRA